MQQVKCQKIEMEALSDIKSPTKCKFDNDEAILEIKRFQAENAKGYTKVSAPTCDICPHISIQLCKGELKVVEDWYRQPPTSFKSLESNDPVMLKKLVPQLS